MTDTRSYQDLSTDPPEQEPRPSDLVADDLPDVDLGAASGRPDDARLWMTSKRHSRTLSILSLGSTLLILAWSTA